MNLPAAFFVLAAVAILRPVAGSCVMRSYGYGSVVCVCNATQCGALGLPPARPGLGAEDGSFTPFMLFSSTKSGMRLHRADGNFTSGYPRPKGTDNDERLVWTRGGLRMSVDTLTKYQTVEGFGGAITDSTAINIDNMSSATKDTLMRALFGPEGNAYTLVRVPIGGTDDSTHTYSYDDEPGDVQLKHFQLADEDVKHKIPVILRAAELTGGELRVMASAWTAPPWMKTNHQFVGGVLLQKMYQVWADYHIRFLSEYAERGVAVWALTTGNEPINAFFSPLLIRFNSMGWTPFSHRTWIARHMGPALRRSPFNATKLLALDDQRMLLPWWIDILFRDPIVEKFVDGIAVHWYWDIMDPRIGLDATHQHFPNKFLISTEASNADKPWDLEKVKLGSWSRGAKYMKDIILDMNSWVTGWMEWSLVLDTEGGPTWSGNRVDVGVLVDLARDEILLQPTYYAMGHFSRFVPRGSRRVRLQTEGSTTGQGSPANGQGLSGWSDVDATAFLTPDKRVVVVMHNAGDTDTSVTVRDPRIGEATVVLPANSFNTMVYSDNQDRGEEEGNEDDQDFA